VIYGKHGGVTVEEELALLRAENQELRRHFAEALELLAVALQRNAELELRNSELEQRVAELEQHQGGPPSFVKRNRSKSEDPKKPRRKRDRQHNHGRHRETPTQTIEHALERCPQCHYRLDGKSLDYTRQVIELPEPQPVEVIEHQVIKRYCPHCQRWQSPKLDLKGQVFGHGRIGVRLASLIAYLIQSQRMPVRRVQDYLATFHRFTVSIGEIVELMHDVREATEGAVANLKRQMQQSRVVHADETGWRENGENGYIWSFSTPGEEAVRYYEYDASRAQAVVKRILAEEFHGHLVSDFYAGYNDYAGGHQRCWVHMLRDLHKLKENHTEEAAVEEWAQAVRKLYDEAQEWLKTTRAPTQEQREKKYVELVGQAHQLGLQYARVKEHPCWALSKRLLRHEDELFQFVLVEGLSADNNLAERSIRPLVVIRKISGGSRSDEGTKSRMALASLFGTWRARGLNGFIECFNLLSQQAAPAS
jgi:transposase